MESSFDIRDLIKLAQQKANVEQMTQYIVIEPLQNRAVISRFKGENDKLLQEVHPWKEVAFHVPSDVWMLREGNDVQVLMCCCSRWHRIIVEPYDGSFSHNASLRDIHGYPEVKFYDEKALITKINKKALIEWVKQFDAMKVVGKCRNEPAIGLTVVLHFDNFLIMVTKESLQLDGTLYGRTPPHLVSLIEDLTGDFKGPEWMPLNAGALAFSLARVT